MLEPRRLQHARVAQDQLYDCLLRCWKALHLQVGRNYLPIEQIFQLVSVVFPSFGHGRPHQLPYEPTPEELGLASLLETIFSGLLGPLRT